MTNPGKKLKIDLRLGLIFKTPWLFLLKLGDNTGEKIILCEFFRFGLHSSFP